MIRALCGLPRRLTPLFYQIKPSTTTVLDDSTDVRITLIGDDQSISILNLSEAKNISVAKKLKLVKITEYDTKTRRPIYRLMTIPEYRDEQIKVRQKKKEEKSKFTIKGEKTITFTHKMGENDFQTRIHNITRWINKRYEVRIIIEGPIDDPKKTGEIFQSVVNACPANGKVNQKQSHENTIKFHFVPIPPSEDGSISENKEHSTNVEIPNNSAQSSINQQKREMHTDNKNKTTL